MTPEPEDLSPQNQLNSTDTHEEAGDGGSSQYVTRKDLRVALIGILALLVAMTPVYLYYREETRAYTCRTNLKAMYDAMTQYSTENDGALPPAYMRVVDGEPILDNGRPYTWAAIVQRYMNPRRSFRCEAASSTELSHVAHSDGPLKSITLSYGMYIGLELIRMEEIDSGTILIAETSKNGYNPKPLAAKDDTFLIGFDNGNGLNRTTVENAQWVTRIAFVGEPGAKDAQVRHHKGTQAISASGSLVVLQPNAMKVERDSRGKIFGRWAIPPKREAEALLGE